VILWSALLPYALHLYITLFQRLLWRKLDGVVIRKFHERDVEDVVEIFASVGLIQDGEDQEKYQKRLRKVALEPPWYDHYLVAELDGKVVGRVILETAYPPYCELINLYVHQDYRRIGVGSNLIQACIGLASKLNCSLMSVMTDPVENLAAHRFYSKFGFRPGILGDPSLERGHMWLFRFSKENFVGSFLWRHPFAEPSVSPSKIGFHGRMLYRMTWRDPQTGEELALYLEGQPNQPDKGTMPRIAGFLYRDESTMVEGVVKELQKTIKEGETSTFTVLLRNVGSKPVELTFNASIPRGTMLSPFPKDLYRTNILPKEEKTVRFKFTWLSSYTLPNFTTFLTVPVTCFLQFEGADKPIFLSAGFERKIS